jgi:hypothetical protein
VVGRRPDFRVTAVALVLVFLVSVGMARARVADAPALDVTFTSNGAISVTLPDGTPVGSTSGSPTVIPAGYYTLHLLGPGSCNELPYFELSGPGANIVNNMDLGEFKETLVADFLPNSTYTWRDDGIPGVVYTFATSATVVGTQPPLVAAGGIASPPKGTTSNAHGVVGSAVLPFRGTLSVTVFSSGRVALVYRGKSVKVLSSGRYTVAVRDRSSSMGLVLERHGRVIVVTAPAFVGRRALSIDLSAARWTVALSPPGSGVYTFSVA